jgi:predicted nicotinamide N-methyase
LLLSAYLSRWRQLQRCCVLELGSGTGLVGLVASRLGAEAMTQKLWEVREVWKYPLVN